MKHKCLFLYSEFEIEDTRERQSVITIRFQGRFRCHIWTHWTWNWDCYHSQKSAEFHTDILIALYGFTAMVWKPDSCSYGYELRTRRHENLETVDTNGNGLFGDTNCHNPRHMQTFADRTKVLYLTIGFLTTCIEAWRSEVTDRVVVSTSATNSPPSVTSEKL